MTEAFDFVSHLRILTNLSACGLAGLISKWLSFYFPNRQQIISVDGVVSKPIPVAGDVIRGNIHGPLFFLMHSKDALHPKRQGTSLMFADDKKIVYKFSLANLSDTTLNIQQD